jgi:phage terminase large subunit-like protein
LTGPLDDFADFCAELTLDNGNPMALEGFQRELLGDYFSGCRESLILLPKKNGKTTLMGALGLYHLLSVPDASVYLAAASREQASLLYAAAVGFIGRSDALREQILTRSGYRELWVADGTGKLRVLASDVDTADGVLPTLALVDELHRHKSPELYGLLLDGLGPRQGQAVTISTAGDDEESALGKLRAKAHGLPGMERSGAHRYVRSADFSMHEWALDPDDDRDDLALVKTANPASWQTVEELRRRKESPSMTPWRWARFACGVWVHGEEAAISDKEWAACADPAAAIPPGAHGVFVGLDLAWRYDCTAAVPICRDGDGMVIGTPAIIAPPGDGTSIDAEDIWAVIEEMAARWPQLTLVADPNAGAPELLQKIEHQLPHVRLAEFPQAPHAMALAAGRLQEAIAAGRVRHPDDPGLTAHVLAAVPVSVGEGFRFKKSKRHGPPIDALIALAMAHSAMVGEEGQGQYRRAAWDGRGRTGASPSTAERIECKGCGKRIHPGAGTGTGLCLKCTRGGVPA